jgi:hypothetical protein
MKHSRLLPTCSDPDVAAEDWDGRGALDRSAARSGLPATIYRAVIDRLTWPPLPYGSAQLIDAAMARTLHAGACPDHALVAWAVLWDLLVHPEQFAARLEPDEIRARLGVHWSVLYSVVIAGIDVSAWGAASGMSPSVTA